MKKQALLQQFPFLKAFQDELDPTSPHHPQLVTIPKGQVIFEANDPCTIIPLLVEGEIRVFSLGETGREMTLYRIHPGESCILSISSLLSQSNIPAIAQVEKEITALVIPAPLFLKWMDKHEPIRHFVYALISKMLANVITTVDEVAFRRLDERILELLEANTDDAQAIHMTHQQIAMELGSSREVVSRILKDFEHKGKVELGRGLIYLK